MFGKKKTNTPTTTIDAAQLELIENAQRRVRQKKRLYYHFIFFLLGSVGFIIANVVLKIGEDYTFNEHSWFVYAIIAWLFLLIYHTISVFITNRFMGKHWERKQIEKLTQQQEERIEQLKQEFLKEERIQAESEAYNEIKKSKEETIKSNLTLVAAVGEDNALGKDNTLIWHLSNDLKRFKKLTSGHHIIMGRKTFESFPKPLPNRTHIVITRQSDYKAPEGVIVVNTIEEAIASIKNDEQPFIIGGGEIYKLALDVADKLEITKVHSEFPEADTFFPEINSSIWKETNRVTHDADNDHAHAYSFITYTKKS